MSARLQLIGDEYGYIAEEDARRARRAYINAGMLVSLIAYDSERNVYVFDVYGHTTTKLTSEY